MRSIIAVGLLVVVCVVAAIEAEAQSHPIIGTWELNLERSTVDPGTGPQRAVHGYVEGEDGFIVYTRSAINSNGTPGFVQIAFKMDGEGYPTYTQAALTEWLTAGTEPPLRMFNATNANTIESTVIEGAGVTITHVVSPDGQSLTTRVGVNTVMVFDRVR